VIRFNSSTYSIYVGNSGAVARENRGREAGGGRWERKGREAGVLRGGESEEKCKMLIFIIY